MEIRLQKAQKVKITNKRSLPRNITQETVFLLPYVWENIRKAIGPYDTTPEHQFFQRISKKDENLSMQIHFSLFFYSETK